MFDAYGETADPYLTLVGYFNATRELAGMRRYFDDDVVTRVRRHGRSKGLSDRIIGATAMLTIQELTSRANGPGLVVTLYNWTRPRDLAHFEDFEPYHATFYRQVEALSVTPFTRRSIDRGQAPAAGHLRSVRL